MFRAFKSRALTIQTQELIPQPNLKKETTLLFKLSHYIQARSLMTISKRNGWATNRRSSSSFNSSRSFIRSPSAIAMRFPSSSCNWTVFTKRLKACKIQARAESLDSRTSWRQALWNLSTYRLRSNPTRISLKIRENCSLVHRAQSANSFLITIFRANRKILTRI